VTQIHLEANISKIAEDSDLVTMERLQEMGTWKSNGHVTDDVTCPVFLLGTDYILSRNF